ncbi:MAG: trehalose-phosphatase [Rhodospirillaceae bacterium]|nr:trehalose-phosphatase [Rhodospirillaceae bacterium]
MHARPSHPPPLDPRTALFLDVDGTLLDIAPTPDAIEVPDGLIETLQRLRSSLAGAVALVSGRRLAELQALFGPAGLVLVGEHGAAPSVPLPSLAAHRNAAPPPALVDALHAFAADHPGTLIELKTHGVALHVRSAPAAAQAAGVFAEAMAIEHQTRVRLLRGKSVYEFAARGVSKGHAVDALLAGAPFRGRIPYVIGDDVTDEDGFAAAHRHGGISLRVGLDDDGRTPSAAGHRIASPAQLRAWLDMVAMTLSSDGSAAKSHAAPPHLAKSR